MGVDSHVNVAGINSVVLGVGHGNEKGENAEDENDKSNDEPSLHDFSGSRGWERRGLLRRP